jgi:hypothetical protein
MSAGRLLNDLQFLHDLLLVRDEGLGQRCEVRPQVLVLRLRCTRLRRTGDGVLARPTCGEPANVEALVPRALGAG